MSVDVFFIGQLGNNLFQYALGRIIAEHLGFELTCHDSPVSQSASPSYQRTQSLTLTSVASYFPNAPLHISGGRYSSPTADLTLRTGTRNGQVIDLIKVLSDRSPRRIRLAGFFQRYEYYEPYLSQIRSWFAMAPDDGKYEIFREDVLVNIRGGKDFAELGWVLEPDYYVNALRRMNGVGKVFVCGVGINAGIREALAPFNPVYIDGSPLDHFRFIQRFDRIVVPNSTFSWWAALLSSAREIYIPEVADKSRFSFKTADIDLEVGDGRYVKIPCRFSHQTAGDTHASPPRTF